MTTTQTWRDPRLGSAETTELSMGPIRYYEAGQGPPVVFVQGWMVNANHWRGTVGALSGRFRCITADWPTGSHELALHPDADLSPPGCARQIAELLEVLDLSDVALVGNDSGGALSQITAANHPGRIGALILTACETPADVWPPPEFAVLTAEAVKPDGLTDLMAALAQVAFRAEPVAYGLLAKHGIPLDVSDTYVQPFLENAAIRHDTHKIMSGAHERYVRAAADTLVSSWDRPALLVWAEDDPVFAPERGRAYAASLPDARFEVVTDSFSFTPEDQPEQLASLIAEFCHARTPAP